MDRTVVARSAAPRAAEESRRVENVSRPRRPKCLPRRKLVNAALGSQFVAALLCFLFALPAQALTLVAQTPVIWGQRNIYSPSALGNRMWIGGWRDVGQVEDAIYISDFNGSLWSQPSLAFSKPGWHVNDPIVVTPPSTGGVDRSAWLYMYYTALDLSCTPAQQCMFTDNVVGWASSIDGGSSWTDHGILIPKQNGIDNCGAWSPGAVVVGTQIKLYFSGAFGHGGCPERTYVFTVDANGWSILSRGTASVPRQLTNIDVRRTSNGVYVMTGNHPNLQSVYRYTSTNGVAFGVPADNPSDFPMISSATRLVLTPHLTQAANGIDLWFALSANLSSTSSVEIHKWTFVP